MRTVQYIYHSIVLHRETDAEVKKLIARRRAMQTRGREFSFNRAMGEAAALWIADEKRKATESRAKKRAKTILKEARHVAIQQA